MKTSLLFVLAAGLVLASCQAPCEKQYFTESPDIDLGKKLVEAYLAGNWDSYPELYADTARIWRNENWTTKEGFTVEQYIEDLKKALEPISSYKMEPQIWVSIINDDGEHWVHFWTVWIGHNDATNKDYEIPLHVSLLVVDNKIVGQGEFYNDREATLDMMAVAQAQEEGETEEGGEEQ